MPLPECLDAALARNPAIRAAEQRGRAASHSAEQASAAQGPSIDVRDTYDRTDRQFNPIFVFPKTAHVLVAELRQPVYNGGRLGSAERQARRQSDRARWEIAETRNGIVENVVRSYLDWVQQAEVNGYYRSAIERDEKLVHEIAVRVEAGKALEADRLQGRIRLLDDQRKLLEGENRMRLARSMLLALMDLPDETDIAPSEDLSLLEKLPTPAAELGESNAALLASSAAVDAASAELERARGESHPTLDVAVRRSRVLDGLGFQSLDADYTDYVAMVDFPLFDSGLRREKKRAAGASLQASRDEYRNARLQKQLELTRARLDLGEAENRVRIAREKKEAASENLRVARERYDAGTVLLSEVLDATASAELAATEGIAARFDRYRARVSMLRLQGRLAQAGLIPARDPNPATGSPYGPAGNVSERATGAFTR